MTDVSIICDAQGYIVRTRRPRSSSLITFGDASKSESNLDFNLTLASLWFWDLLYSHIPGAIVSCCSHVKMGKVVKLRCQIP